MHSSELEGVDKGGGNHQSYITCELGSALADRDGNPRDGVLGVVLPTMEKKVYGNSYKCEHCHKTINFVNIGDETVIREFSMNYYLKPNSCGHYSEDVDIMSL